MKNNFSKILGAKMLRVTDVYNATKISRTTLADLYYQRAESPKLETLMKICDFLEVSLSELIEYEPQKKEA